MEESEEASAAMGRKRQREVPEAAAAARVPRQLTYLPIADALKLPDAVKAREVRVSLFAVVSEIGATVRSRGTDFACTLRIVDPSRTPGISATFFAEDPALLPCVKSSGDVISLRNVVVTRHQDLFVKYNKRSSSFALFESNVSAQCSPYQTSEKYHGCQHDKEQLTQMRTWLSDNPLGPQDHELQLKSLKSDFTFDLVCKVLHVVHDVEDSGRWIFYVWDGTDTPAAELQAISDAEAVQTLPLCEGPPLPREVLCTMPFYGTVLRIFSDSFFKEASHMQNSTYWARFWNITCKQEFGIWKGVFMPSSGVRLLSDKDGSVVDRLKMYDSRKANKFRRRPMASLPSNVADINEAHDDLVKVLLYMYCIDEVLRKVVIQFCCHMLPTKGLPHDNLSSILSGVHLKYKQECYSTLMRSLTHPEVLHRVKTVVRVVAACPCRASELCFLATGKYVLRLTLEDPTARINAYVHNDDMGDFFGPFLTEEVIIKKVNKLLGVTEPEDSEEVAPLTRNPPWIWCILKSYYLDEEYPWKTRRYRIIATEIMD